MLLKLEAISDFAKFEQIFHGPDEIEEAHKKAAQMRGEGWTVTLTNLGNVSKAEYAAARVLECYETLAEMYVDESSYH